jgi:hypothetical protein
MDQYENAQPNCSENFAADQCERSGWIWSRPHAQPQAGSGRRVSEVAIGLRWKRHALFAQTLTCLIFVGGNLPHQYQKRAHQHSQQNKTGEAHWC